MATPRLISFSGSTRSGSFNQAVATAATEAAREAGAEVEQIDLSDYALPLYNGDLEDREGIPKNALALKKKFIAADGFIISSPEYNSGYSPLLKNTIDWCSRAESEEEEPLAAYDGKSILLLSASPGPLGGLRGLFAIRSVFQNIGVTVFPEMLSVRSAHQVIEKGRIADEKWSKKIKEIATDYVAFACKLSHDGRK